MEEKEKKMKTAAYGGTEGAREILHPFRGAIGFQQSGVYPFLLQSFKEIRHLYKHLDFAGCLAQTGCSALS